jgi:hypothetical protein
MLFDDCVKKFRDCSSYAAGRLSNHKIVKAIALVSQLEQLEDVGEIMKLLK